MYNEALKNYRINNTFEDFKADVFDDDNNIIKEKYISFCKNKVQIQNQLQINLFFLYNSK